MKYKIEIWNIEDIINNYNDERLNLNPNYQRRYIWKLSDQQTLIESILSGFAIPNIFLHKKGSIYEVVDGQQRLRTILGFYNKVFKRKNGGEYDEEVMGKDFRGYQIPVTIITEIEPNESIESFYSLVNSAGIHLNRPELKKAEYFDTNFLKLVTELCSNGEFVELDLFTDSTTKRMNDIDFVSELVTLLIYGITDKKQSVDKLFEKDIDPEEFSKYKNRFIEIIKIFVKFNSRFPIKKTRFKQRNDFYTIFGFVKNHFDLNSKLLYEFYDILVGFGRFIVPSNEKCEPFQEYAFHCISQSNSKAAREARNKIIEKILLNNSDKPNNTQKKILKFFDTTPEEGMKNVYGNLTFDIKSLNLEAPTI